MTTQYVDPNAFLMGGGIPSAKFETIGTTVSGPITEQPKVDQQTDIDTGKPLFWDDGRPRQQLVVTVQTDLRDPAIEDDDGLRRFYIKFKMQDAVREAVRKARSKGLEIGGVLSITYVADDEAKTRGKNPAKLYSAVYTPPSAAQANDFLNGGQPAPAAPQAPQQYAPPAAPPAPQAAPAPAPAAAPAGVDAGALQAALASLSPEQRAALKL
ncbi:hypothetical protein Ssi03_25670 [Sphaerisporangium siamense]|uniref:Pyruvate/2-oxoglutarate dehydrogenase complex dihydrolipoamide acyltransferase (E2) component n=1 Tax=Sphaerisporangium siamense TaxID=795645 RepID=A0A7W7D4M4_9ACTN|nr:hypothetical protein [Sphaerisporangium siamense]MBB4700107.1 pyruvate/2-oxoglutarate dehydrogenase complex dihydrolipoamide acyltransferase (E2) component [Sphaerisporangium siamense]GII84577.1 hypothetical protein Ssi03_25670 [Sphaerisporangium siamense]